MGCKSFNVLCLGIFVLRIFNLILDVKSIDATCRGKRINERCSCDEDCDGFFDRCLQGKCTCSFDFEEYSIDDRTKVCRPAGAAIGATCQTGCKAPLLCKNGKCFCFGGKPNGNQCEVSCNSGEFLVGQECMKISTIIGGLCSSDQSCQIPNSYCKSGICQCVPGSTRSGNSCNIVCPDGKVPLKTCRKILTNDAAVQANGEKQDTCPKGYTCATFGKPNIGHCCQLYCPYGQPDLAKNCESGASIPDRCPSFTTHYCQNFEDHGGKNSLCCPRPCREPTPLFINGRCLAKAHRGDPCVEDGQCEGGATMQCKAAICVCRPGYGQINGTFASCTKTCNILTQVNIDGGCFLKVNVGDPCFHSTMCPLRSICREGLCQCDCSSALSRGTCIDPDDPININKLTEVIKGILNPGGTNNLPNFS